MKIFKIVNSFVFLFVINLSITFLDKNNLFVTFINGILQTDNKNLCQRKQRSLAESKNLSAEDPNSDSNNNIIISQNKYFATELATFNMMLYHIRHSSTEHRNKIAYDIDLYNNNYKNSAALKEMKLLYLDMDKSYNRYIRYLRYLSSLIEVRNQAIHVTEKVSKLHNLTKKLVNMYIKESNRKLKKEILAIDYIKKFISSNYTPCTPEHEINPEDVLKLARDMVDRLKLEKLIS